MFKFDIYDASGDILFTAELDRDYGNVGVNKGNAVIWAVRNAVSLEGAYLVGAYLQGAYIAGANLRRANLRRAYLVGVDLTSANLMYADLTGANLTDACLENARLAGAKVDGVGLEIPIIENIHQKVYKAASQRGALDMYDWHTCETTHCWAGWVVVLAGEKGIKLEEKVGTSAAADLIYSKSDPDMKVIPDFYADDEDALAEMKQLAKQEKNND